MSTPYFEISQDIVTICNTNKTEAFLPVWRENSEDGIKTSKPGKVAVNMNLFIIKF